MQIVGLGARTPVGLQAPASAAAVRAGISRLREHPFLKDRSGDPVKCGLDPLVEPRLFGAERMIVMGEAAIREALQAAKNLVPQGQTIPLLVALPELRPGFDKKSVEHVKHHFSYNSVLSVPFAVQTFADGHAAGAKAFHRARQLLESGVHSYCLVGGVESYVHPDTLEWLEANGQLHNRDSRSGFAPGEGAGFCLVVKPARHSALRVQANIVAVATEQEAKLIKTDAVCLGEGLCNAVRKAAAVLGSGEKIHQVFCDINGERYRGEEWGFVCLRASQYFDDVASYDNAVDCWGDMGAASVSLLTMLACRAAARGYAKGPRSLISTSSEGGLRGVLILEQEVAQLGAFR